MTHSIDALKRSLPGYAKDLKLNLESVLTSEGSPGLSDVQIWGSALAAAMALRHEELIATIEAESTPYLGDDGIDGAKVAAATMGMTNAYYRTLHMMKDSEYAKMPAGLRMNALKTHGAAQVDFDVWALAASVIGQCGGCVNAHDKAARDEGLTRQGIQSAIRIASVLHAVAIVLTTESATQKDSASTAA